MTHDEIRAHCPCGNEHHATDPRSRLIAADR
jgi:hypothetical protein